MPITKTAKRALRGSKRKKEINDRIRAKLEIAIRMAKRKKSKIAISDAFSAVDRAAKKNIIHKNKAARIKAQLSKLTSKKKSTKTK